MPRETMTPRERWLAVLRRQTPDRVPMDYWATPETTQRLLAHLGCDFPTMVERLRLDLPLRVEPQYVGPPVGEDEDAWGLRYTWVDHGTGAYREARQAPWAAFDSVEQVAAGYRWRPGGLWRGLRRGRLRWRRCRLWRWGHCGL